MYEYKYFFVKPSSTFPADDVDSYFVDRCNYYQNNTTNYIIGSLFNARDMQSIMYFSDKTKDAHDMDVNKILLNSTTESKLEPRIPVEIMNEILIPARGLNSILTDSQSVSGVVYQ